MDFRGLWIPGTCRICAERLGQPSIARGVYFRMLLIGYFEGMGSERGIAWRVAGLAVAAAVSELRPERGHA